MFHKRLNVAQLFFAIALNIIVSVYCVSSRASTLVHFPQGTEPDQVAFVVRKIEQTTEVETRGIVAISQTTKEHPIELPQEAIVALDRARSAYKELDLERASASAEEAEKKCLDNLPVTVCRRLLFDARMLVGMAGAALGNQDMSAQAFRSAHAVDPSRVADPRIYPPQIVRAFSGACAAGERATPIRIRFLSTPLGASFWIDGVEADPSNEASLSPGRHIIEASLLGYKSLHRIVEVELGASTPKQVAIKLAPLPEAEAWEEMKKGLSSQFPDISSLGLAALLKRFDIDRIIVFTKDVKHPNGFDAHLILPGIPGTKPLAGINPSAEPSMPDFVNGLKDALGMTPPPEPEPAGAPPLKISFNDDKEEDDESSSIRLRPEDADESEEEKDDTRKLFTSPWFWVSIGAAVALVAGVVIITQVN